MPIPIGIDAACKPVSQQGTKNGRKTAAITAGTKTETLKSMKFSVGIGPMLEPMFRVRYSEEMKGVPSTREYTVCYVVYGIANCQRSWLNVL